MVLIDASWIDIGSVGISGVAAIHRPIRRKIQYGRCKTTTREMIKDALNGAAIVPFLLMIGSVASSQLLSDALMTNKAYMGLGGIIGVLAVLGEMLADDGPFHR